MTKLQEESKTERATARFLQDEAEKTIKGYNWSNQDLAERLGLLDLGAENLRAKTWSLQTAFRVADAIGLQIQVSTARFGEVDD